MYTTHDNDFSTHKIKNARETELCLKYLTGNRILTFGKGIENTYQLLQETGCNVSGIHNLAPKGSMDTDSSENDIQHLSIESNTFSTLIALNCTQHLSDFESILAEWSRVVEPNGRLIFNFSSLDYEIKFQNKRIENDKDNTNITQIEIKKLIHFANKYNLNIIKIIPYGELYNPKSRWLTHSNINSSEWNRLLSRSQDNEKFFEFLNFLDSSIVANLSTAMSSNCMIILEKSLVPVNNDHWIKDHDKITKILSKRFSLNDLKPFLEEKSDVFLEKISFYLDDIYALSFVFKLWSLVDYKTNWLHLESFLASQHLSILTSWAEQKSKDTTALNFVENWHRLPLFKENLFFGNVPLGPGFEYELISELLTHIGAFNKDIQ